MCYVLAILTFIGCWIHSVPVFALGPLVVYGKEDASYDDILYYRSFSSSWGSEGTAVDTNVSGALTNHVAVTRPDGREQAVVAWATGSSEVHVTIYNGTNWDNGSGSPFSDAKVITGASNVFAAAYEQNSGQLLIAVGSGTAQMKYYLWNGSSWIIDGSTQSFAYLTQTVQQIRMASKPGAAEIALMANDGNNCVGLIWDGSANSWGNEQKLNTDSVSLHYAAAVTYMQTGTYGGRALFVWDETYTESPWTYHRLNSREWTGSIWQSSTELLGSQTPAVYRIELAADPGSDDVLIVYQFSNGPIWAMAYTGSYGSPQSIATGYGSPSYNRPFNAIFESASGHSGHFLIVFSDTSQLKSWHFTSISNLASYTQSTIGSSSTDCYWIDLARTADGATIHLIGQVNVNTSGDTLAGYTWNNTSWTSQGNLTTGLLVYLDSSRGTKPFALTLQPPAPALTQAHTRWRNNDGSEAAGTVAVSAYSGAVPASSGSSVTVSHTVSGSNRLLLVGVSLGCWTGYTTRTVTSATWNGTALSLVGAVNHVTSPVRSRTEIWKLVAPATGTYDVVVNLSGSLDSTYYQAVVSVMSFTGVDQTTPLGTYASTSGTASSQSLTISSAAGELAYAVCSSQSYGLTNSGNTEYWNDSGLLYTKAAGGTKAGASSVTMTWTKSSSSSWTMSGVSIKPAAAASWTANEDTPISGLTKSTTRRLRFMVSNTGAAGSVASYKLQVAQTAACGSGTYSDVTTGTSGHWAVTDTAYYTNGDATTNVSSGLTDPGGYSFQAGQALDTSGSTGTINLNAATFTEIEFAVQATDNAILGADYCFRLYDATAGTTFDTYTNYGQASLQAMSLTQAHYRWRNDNGTDTSGTPTVAVAAAAVTGTVSGSSTLTLSDVQVPAGTNRLLMVGVSYKFIAGYSGVDHVQSVTWNGRSLSNVKFTLNGLQTGTSIWMLADPQVATSNVIVTFVGNAYAVAGAVPFTGASETLGTASGSTGQRTGAGTTTASASVTTSANDLVFAVLSSNNSSVVPSIVTGTSRWSQKLSTPETGSGATNPASGASTSVSWTVTGTATNYWSMSLVPIRPATSESTATFAVAEDAKLGLERNTLKRIRLMVSNQSGASTGALQYQLQVAETGTCSSGSYTAVGSSAHWQMADSTYFADEDSTGNVASGLTDPGGFTFAAGQFKDANDTTYGINLGASQFTEVEFAVRATAGATGGGDYCFRLYNATSGAALNTYTNYGAARVLGVTAIDLLSFVAAGEGAAVRIAWETAQESDNKGFRLLRAQSRQGPYIPTHEGLISSASVGGEGRRYEFVDDTAAQGLIYYYRLEDVDVSGAVTPHGPVCVDWDGDGLPDDWEQAYGLDPGVDDAAVDSDGDGASNLLEYQRGTDPFSRDTDGDGIPDGAERKIPGYSGGAAGGLEADGAVQVLAADARGVTLELVTKGFDVIPVAVGGERFERLRVPAYVHGYTLEAGQPQLPLKGVLLDVPAGKQARVEVLDATSRVIAGYRVYPAPLYQAGAGSQVAEVFSWDEAAYAINAIYPALAAELSGEYVYRGQVKQRLLLYPLRFNPGTGELLHSERIRVRVEYEDAASAAAPLRAAAASSMLFAAPSPASGWSIPAGAAFKVSTDGEGITRITRDWLTAQGIGATEIDAINLATAQLFNLGVEQAVHVYDQNGNNCLDAADHITFYATAVPAAYRKYARYNVYWLANAGGASPQRMASLDGTPAGGPLAVSHTATVHHELDQVYLQSAVGPDAMDRWIFSEIASGSGFSGGGVARDFALSLPGALASGDLTIRMYSPYEMAHETTVSVNGAAVGSAAWSGIGWTEAAFAGVSLLDGANTVSLLCTGSLDKTATDWFEVVYERGFAAAADVLKFTHAGGYRYRVTGLTSADAELYDVTDPAAVRRVVNGSLTGSGPYTLEAEPAGASGSRSYLAVASGALKTPVAVVKDRASALASASNAADWILIIHRSLGWDGAGAEQGWVTSLTGLRQSQGLRTQVVDIEDVFDEFGYGLPTPQAVKDFLAHAYGSWQSPAPQYVLLAGDTSYDYKDNWGAGTVNLVPGYLIHTTHLGETISDEWYGQVSGEDAVADLHIGRLPASTLAQAQAMAAKIVAYETAANTKSWQKTLVLAADNQTESWESVFETMNEDAAALLPSSMAAPERFYLQEYENESLAVTDLTADLLSAIEAGALIVNYSGHGSVNLWASERILDNRGGAYRSDVSSLTNAGMYPFVVNMSCLTGYFIYPQAGAYAADSWRSQAEGWLWPASAGAVATLMPTGMTDTVGQHLLSNALYEAIFTLDRRVLGQAVGYARQQLMANGGSEYEQTSNTFMFFGDPATVLKVPLPRRPQQPAAVRQADGTVELAWGAALDCDGAAVAGYHLYRRVSSEAGYTRVSATPVTGLTYTDTGIAGAPAGAVYYYALAALDGAGDESAKSAPAAVSVPAATESSNAAGGGGGCFIASAGHGHPTWMLAAIATMALTACTIRLGRRRIRRDDRCTPYFCMQI